MLLLVGSASCVALLISPVPLPLQLFGWAMLSAVFLQQWRVLSQTRTLTHHGGSQDTVNLWQLQTGCNNATEASLLNSGYSSAGLLILIFHDENTGALVRVPVWFDSTTKSEFSYLNLQLMFNATSAQSGL